MDIIILIIALIWSILAIVLFFKIWGMTNDVAEINKQLGLLVHKDSRCGSPTTMPHSDPTQETDIPFNPNTLSIGSCYIIVGFGKCKYEGVFKGNHFFYPVDTSRLGDSPYLVGGDEPYLEIPPSQLSNYISSKC